MKDKYNTPGGKTMNYSYSTRIWLEGRQAKDSYIYDERGFRLGSEVNVIEYSEKITPFMDDDVSKELLKIFKKEKINFYLSSKVFDVKSNDSNVIVKAENKSGEILEFVSDYCLVSVGRKPYTENLGLNSVGVDRVLTVDLHSESIQGFFDMPADNVYATKLMVEDISKHYSKDNLVIVSPDVGGVVRSRALAKYLDGLDLAIIDKRRDVANESEVMNIIGDVAGKECIVPDDIIDTAGTLCNAAKALKDAGASKVSAYITHPVLSGPAIERISNSEIDELVVTNSIPLTKDGQKCSKIRVISIAPLISECIKRLSNEESLSAVFL